MPSKGRPSTDEEMFRFLDLPRELRNQIYRELLLTGKVYEWSNIPNKRRLIYHYQPDILQTNKQIYSKASKVIYDENVWVIVSMCIPSVHYEFHQYPRTSSKYLDNFRGKISLKVRVDRINRLDKYPRTSFLIAPEQLYELWRTFPGSSFLSKARFNIVLNSASPVLSNNLLNSFRDLRTTGQVSLLGVEPASLGLEISRLMAMEALLTLDTVQERVDVFRTRGQQELDVKRPFSAFMAFHEGYMYFDQRLRMHQIYPDWTGARLRRVRLIVQDVNIEEKTYRALIDQGYAMFSGMALSCVHLHTAKLLEARRQIRGALEGPLHTEIERTQVRFFSELSSAPRQFYGSAIDMFDLVVRRLPIYDVVRKELDSLEQSNQIDAGGKILSTMQS